jgi:O-antigen ligase
MKLEWYGKRVDVRRLLLFLVIPGVVLIGAGAFFLPPGFVRLAVLVLLGLPLVLLLLDRPTLIFYMLTLIIFSNLDVFAPVRLYRFVLLVLVAAFAVALAQGRRVVVHHSVLLALAGAFLILAFQSLSVARDFDVAIKRLEFLAKSLFGVALAVQFVRDRREFRRFLLVVAAGILLNNFLPLVIKPPTQFASLSMVWSQGFFRYEGFAFEPNTFAMFQIFLIPLLMVLMTVYRKPVAVRALFPLSILASIVVLVLSFSRGGFVGLVVLFALLLLLEWRNKPLLIFGLVVIAIGIGLAPTVYWDRVKSMLYFSNGERPDYAIFTRLETMKTAVRLGFDNPLLGVGLDNFLYHSSRYLPFKMVVHNTFLQVLAEVGIIAVVLFAGIIGCNIALMKRMSERRDDPEAAQIGRLLLIQHLAVLTNSLFIPIAYDTVFLYMLALPALADYAYRTASSVHRSSITAPRVE